MSCFLRSFSFLFLVSNFLNTFASPPRNLCHPDQRDALLEFKTEFGIKKPASVDSDAFCYPKTESWVNRSDCCSWDGIMCDTESGQVVELDLEASCLHGRFESKSSLFRLIHLRDLNLANNNFTASPIPAQFDTLKELKRLNLSNSSFSGHIPTKLLQLTKLVSLDLSSFSSKSVDALFIYPQNSLSVDESFLPLVAQNLRSLEVLDMSYINISSKVPHEFSTMRFRSLHFEGCNLFGEFPSSVLLMPTLSSIILDHNPNLRGNLPNFQKNHSMQILSLSETSFSGTIPDSISNLKHLTSLSLRESNFSGKIPSSLGSLSHLSYLDLFHNNFTGAVPYSLGNLSHLSSLILSYNNFTSEIPFSVGNLSNLSYLDLSFNNFTGEIPSSFENLKHLTFFSVWDNNLSGNFPSALLNLTELRTLSVCTNQFTGVLPPNISQLTKLEGFMARSNYFTGAIPSSIFKISSLTQLYLNDNHFTDLDGVENLSLLPNLQKIYLGNNNFRVRQVDLNVFSSLKQLSGLGLSGIPLSTGNITSYSDFSSHLENLDLSGCNITEFPEFIRDQRDLVLLDLSNNKIKGQVPNWLWELPVLYKVDLSNNSLTGFDGSLKASSESQITAFDISSNAFQGPIFIPSTSIQYFFASKNNFTGEIPRSVCELSSLSLLDLSSNNLHGSIPRCLETRMSSLSDLNLRNNILSGSLPDIFMHAKELRSLDVSHNQLEGNLPVSLTGCSALEVLNVESNRFSGMFPFQLNSLQKLQVLVLRANKFHGMLHHSDGGWFGFPQLKIIDVSHNDFLGTLPSDFFLNWTAISSKGDNMTEADYIGDPRDYGYYTSLVLMSKGVSMAMERILTIYTAIDFSGNELHGKVPDSVGLLKELRILNLSSNAFTGHIPSPLANLTNLESLDLSQNKISGEIPPELGTLSSLAWINISHNQLVGSLPQGTQFLTQNCSSYEGNPGLNLQSLKDVCGDIHSPTPPQPEPLETEEEDDEWINWIAAGIGVAPGVVLGLTIGYIVASHKPEWFMKTLGRNKHKNLSPHPSPLPEAYRYSVP